MSQREPFGSRFRDRVCRSTYRLVEGQKSEEHSQVKMFERTERHCRVVSAVSSQNQMIDSFQDSRSRTYEPTAECSFPQVVTLLPASLRPDLRCHPSKAEVSHLPWATSRHRISLHGSLVTVQRAQSHRWEAAIADYRASVIELEQHFKRQEEKGRSPPRDLVAEAVAEATASASIVSRSRNPSTPT